MKALALLLVLCAAVAVTAGGYPRFPQGGNHHRNDDDGDVDVKAKVVDEFKGKVQDLNLCECDATNAFVSVFDGKIGQDADDKAFIEFSFILDNSGEIVTDAASVFDLGVLVDLHGACDNCNDLVAVQGTPTGSSSVDSNGGVTIVPCDAGCTLMLTDDQVKGKLRVYLRDGGGAVNAGLMPTDGALTLGQVLARTNGRFFAQIFLIKIDSFGQFTRFACATLTGTITPKSCAGNKWGVGQNNVCAGTQCSRGVKQRLGRAVGQAKTFDCCDDTDVFGCCAAAGKSDPSTCAAVRTHHHCGPDKWKCDLSTSFSWAKERNYFTSAQSNWAEHEANEFGRSALSKRTASNTGKAANTNARFEENDGDSRRRGGDGGGYRRGG